MAMAVWPPAEKAGPYEQNWLWYPASVGSLPRRFQLDYFQADRPGTIALGGEINALLLVAPPDRHVHAPVIGKDLSRGSIDQNLEPELPVHQLERCGHLPAMKDLFV